MIYKIGDCVRYHNKKYKRIKTLVTGQVYIYDHTCVQYYIFERVSCEYKI